MTSTTAAQPIADAATPAAGGSNTPKPAHPKMKMADRLPLLVKWALKHKAGFTLAQLAAANDISLGVAKYSWPDERVAALLAEKGLTWVTVDDKIVIMDAPKAGA